MALLESWQNAIDPARHHGDGPFAADFGEGRRLLQRTLYHATFLPLRTSLSSTRLRSASINVGISR